MSIMEAIDCREALIITVPGKVMTKGSMRFVPNKNRGGMPVPLVNPKNVAWQSRISAAAILTALAGCLYFTYQSMGLWK